MTGTLSMSVELELGWGSVQKPPHRQFEQFADRERKRETAALHELLTTCETAGTPISFNVVGHLFQQRCHHKNPPHEEGWFDIDPGSDASSDPLFYAPDLVETIAESSVDHEICTHTFSHVPVDEVEEEVLRWELQACFKKHESAGLPRPTTLVTPYNRPAPAGPLLDFGITAVREPVQQNLNMSRPRKLLWYLTRDPPTREPTLVDGLTRVYTSVGISLASFSLRQGARPPHPAFRVVPERVRRYAHRRYLDRALALVRAGEHVHLWCHVYDLANEVQLDYVTDFLRLAGRCASEHEIEIRTIRQIDDELRN